MKIYTSVIISPHHAGFGMYERGEIQSSPENSWAYFQDLISEMSNNLFSLMKIEDALDNQEFIEAGIEDIRGKIYNEPSHIYAAIDDYGSLIYFGIVESEVSENFFN